MELEIEKRFNEDLRKQEEQSNMAAQSMGALIAWLIGVAFWVVIIIIIVKAVRK